MINPDDYPNDIIKVTYEDKIQRRLFKRQAKTNYTIENGGEDNELNSEE